ncbi:hypothetical protein ACFSUJ_12335 [Streptomyces lusitanus]|uniref:Uncharacterized protein n=1 Tax=Streptomyces lusitanus TaxID=68232 RepID=A0ABU3JPC8_9ACTN|nr:hypothetical protein [Streptomyces lusitanus]
MAQSSWPSPAHNSRAVTDVEYEKIAARFSDDGVDGSPSDAAVVAAGVGLNVTIRANVYASVRGHAWTSGTSAVTLAISANASGQTRTDRVVLRLDRSDWTVRAVVKTGAPGAGVPALTQSTGDTGVYEIPLAEVTVLNGAASVTVTRRELWVGSRVRACTSATRNPAPAIGEMCLETDTGLVRMWDGAAWVVIYRTAATASVDVTLSSWTATGSSVLERRGDVVVLRTAYFERKVSNLAAASDSRLPLLIPSTHRHPYLQMHEPVYLSGHRIGMVTLYPGNHERAGQLWLNTHPGVNVGQIVYTTTMTWAV